MRTFPVVPSFEGESAYFELPDVGFQGDHLSFAILFNLTELTEHWPDIIPSMIVTDPKGNTFIAPHTSWNSVKHEFTWYISSTETTYDGYLLCQLKCTAADDPDTIVCMSRICQTKVYQSLEAASDPPEAFQTWIDTLVQLGAEITDNADEVRINTEATEINARTASAAAEAAVSAKNSVDASKLAIDDTAADVTAAKESALNAQQRAQNAASAADEAKTAAQEAQYAAETALDEVETLSGEATAAKNSAAENAERSSTSATRAETAQAAAELAKDAAVSAKGAAEVAQGRAEAAEEGALRAQTASETAQGLAENAQTAAETAQNLAETAQQASETAQSLAEDAQSAAEAAQSAAETAEDLAKRWAIGVDREGNEVDITDPTYNNYSKFWSDAAKAARDTVLAAPVSTAFYDAEDESVTLVLGGNAILHQNQGV